MPTSFSGSGSPVGRIIPQAEGDLYIDIGSPNVYQATGATALSWEAIGGGGSSSEQIFYAVDYGARFDYQFGVGGTNNTSALRACLAAANAYNNAHGYPGAVVQLPQGQGMISGGLTCTGATWLRGYGVGATVLYCHNWDLVPDAVITLDANSAAGRVSDFAITADSGAGQAGMHGIDVETAIAPYGSGGELTLIENMFIQFTGGYGVKLSALEARLNNVYTCRNVAGGFWINGTDNVITRCTADTPHGSDGGFLIQGSNNRVSACKAFGGDGTAPGFNVNGFRNTFAVCEAQDMGGDGFNVIQGPNAFSSCLADSCGQVVATSHGFVLNDDSAATACIAVNRDGGTALNYGFYGQNITGSQKPTVTGCVTENMATKNLGGVFAYAQCDGVPTADPHIAGQVWSNSGVLTVSAG